MFFNNKRSFGYFAEELKHLALEFMYGKSSKDDLIKWEEGLKSLYETIDNRKDRKVFKDEVESVFFDYLLKYYPEDDRLLIVYEKVENVNRARIELHKKMALTTLAQVLNISKDIEVKDLVNEYLHIPNGRKDIFELTTKGAESTAKGILNVLRKVRKYIPSKTKDEISWHLQLDALGTFVV